VRRFVSGAALLLLLGAVAVAADPVRLPAPPSPPDVPRPMPSGVFPLAEDAIYPVQSDVELVIRSCQPGVIEFKKEKPGSYRYKSGGKWVAVDLTGPIVYVGYPLKKGRADVEFIPLGFKAETEIAKASIDVAGGDTPNPPNPPGPKPAPDGDLGLIKISRDSLSKIPNPDKQADLAAAQRAHASAVAAGAFPSAAAITAGWRAANNRVEPDLTKLAAFQETWKPWASACSARLGELYSAGKLPDNAAWAKAYNEIAEGLGG
jgi:hypothetical protein